MAIDFLEKARSRARSSIFSRYASEKSGMSGAMSSVGSTLTQSATPKEKRFKKR